ncbi:hypothetical protein A3F45_03355 [Candidatus Curtissbacteria bacterium RIFCSPHIGHO2_12_FULL_41_17]|uniref:DUF2079 domain-containing protein n=2 Tax=Candidatus Curtissiibacteriota TaxID=1752717 RepID=A0A1F5HK95_9BACT|nr:MAG: hypothetical protein A2693_03720 [Candidatus Curtissbacteria bacterium RIFCSPHIGHO2_01_FULL_40_12]OGE04523.1 MAG: hypothetical protein A3F45_03355 [Candidatus Curtissbacteria bacterium RIFCSPHIGHO2_12_FULL_41_17]
MQVFVKRGLSKKADFWAIVLVFLLFSFLYSLLSVIRHNHFQSQGIDFSIYDQSLWLYSKFKYPYSTVTSLHDLADRFRPIMFPLSTLYWFSENERILLLFQSVILSSAVFPIWLIAKRYLPKILAIVIAFLYIDFIGIQATAVYDFHEMSLLPFFLAWLFYFLLRGKWIYYFIALFISLSVREHVGFLLATLGIYVWLVKKNARIAIATLLISLIWSIVAIKVFMPALGQEGYQSFVREGEPLEDTLLGYFVNPLAIVNNFFLPVQKMQTLFWSFFSFGLIPIFYLPLTITVFFQFASRFLDQLHPIRWTIFYHYSAELAVLLAVSTVFTSRFILERFKGIKYSALILVMLLMFAHVGTNLLLNSPLKNLLKPQFYKHQSWMDNTRLVLAQVPKNASVASQNNLLPHLSHREKIYLLPNVNNADYVVVDLHSGQDDWNFYNQDLGGTRSILVQLVKSNSYKVIISSGDVYLLKNFDKNI